MKIKITFLMLLMLQFPLSLAHNGEDHLLEKTELKISVELLSQNERNQKIGFVTVRETPFGLIFIPELKKLTSGIHGFHIHQNPSCLPKEKNGKQVLGLSAGGHWDPENTNQHGFPWTNNNHLGDLPSLYVDKNGHANIEVLAPRLKKLEQIKGRSLMIHQHGDNHSDSPKKLGGGGSRMACGIIN